MAKDSLGDRMKQDYEQRAQTHLPRRTYTVIRVDGKAFHSYTRGCVRPFDDALMEDMDATMRALCEGIEGACLGYCQSDEISVILTDFSTPQTEAWFDANVQKLVSISASMATAEFNYHRFARWLSCPDREEMPRSALFDSRAFTIPDPTEVENYMIWRQQDATRNSIAMAAQARFSHKQLFGKGCPEMQEMLFGAGVNWNDYPDGCKRGRCAWRDTVTGDVVYTDKRTGKECRAEGVTRRVWRVEAPPIFTKDREWLRARLPRCS